MNRFELATILTPTMNDPLFITGIIAALISMFGAGYYWGIAKERARKKTPLITGGEMYEDKKGGV